MGGGVFMARGYTNFTESKIEERIKKGYGCGEGIYYKPWLKIGDFHSAGRSHRILGIKTKRSHHFFSDLEARYFYCLEWTDSVVDIREQYPLFSVTDTEYIADALQYKHPWDPKTEINIVMTTDFLITCMVNGKETLKARSVKYEKDLKNQRTIEKQAIEECYWKNHNIEWKLVTENSFSGIKSDNIKDLLKHYENPLIEVLDKQKQTLLKDDLFKQILQSSFSLSAITTNLDADYELKNGTSLSFFKYLVVHKEIPINMEIKFKPTRKTSEVIDIEKLKTNIVLGDNRFELIG